MSLSIYRFHEQDGQVRGWCVDSSWSCDHDDCYAVIHHNLAVYGYVGDYHPSFGDGLHIVRFVSIDTGGVMYLNVTQEEFNEIVNRLPDLELAKMLRLQVALQAMTNAEKIKYLTETRGLTVKQLAAKAHLTAFHFNQILAGKRNGGNMTTKFLDEMLLDRSE